MCGRFARRSTHEVLADWFGIESEEMPFFAPTYNAAPQSVQPVVRLSAHTGKREFALMRWGLVPFWAKDAKLGLSTINARAEEAASKPLFREALKRRRCLVPADGFYEWLKLEWQRHPFHIRRRDRRPFAFAGVWGRWQPKHALPIERFTILTCPPSDLVRPLHDRMPVILPAAAWEPWLSPDADAADLRALLVPWAGDELEAVPVSSAVNRADHEGADCVREVPRPVARQLSLLAT